MDKKNGFSLLYYRNGEYEGVRDSDFDDAFGESGNDGAVRALYDLAEKEHKGEKNRIVARNMEDEEKYVLLNPEDSSIIADVEYYEKTGRAYGAHRGKRFTYASILRETEEKKNYRYKSSDFTEEE